MAQLPCSSVCSSCTYFIHLLIRLHVDDGSWTPPSPGQFPPGQVPYTYAMPPYAMPPGKHFPQIVPSQLKFKFYDEVF